VRVAIAVAIVIRITTGSKVDVFVFVFIRHGDGAFHLVGDDEARRETGRTKNLRLAGSSRLISLRTALFTPELCRWLSTHDTTSLASLEISRQNG
jgi:hypothetical protein